MKAAWIRFGVAQMIVALAIFMWARNHSPHVGSLQTIAGPIDSYMIQEPAYSVVLLVAAVLALLGVITIVRGLQVGKG